MRGRAAHAVVSLSCGVRLLWPSIVYVTDLRVSYFRSSIVVQPSDESLLTPKSFEVRAHVRRVAGSCLMSTSVTTISSLPVPLPPFVKLVWW